MTPLKHRIHRMLVSRPLIMGINTLLTYFALVILNQLLLDLRGGTLRLQDLERTIQGLAVLTVSYGVVLENRRDLQEILGLYPARLTETEQRIDQVCHDFGISILLFGLFMEIPNQAVKIPNHLINTHGIEDRVLLLSVPFILATLIAALLANWRLIRLPPLRDRR